MVDLDQRYLIIIIIVIIEIDMPNILVTLLIIYLQPQHHPPLLRLRLLALLLDRQRPTTDRGGTDFVTTLPAPTSASARPDRDNSCPCELPNTEWN
jgi:hypothetical protein